MTCPFIGHELRGMRTGFWRRNSTVRRPSRRWGDDVKMYVGERVCKDGVADIIFSIRCLGPSGSACKLLIVIDMTTVAGPMSTLRNVLCQISFGENKSWPEICMRPAQANNLTLLKTDNYLHFFRPITGLKKRFGRTCPNFS